MSGPAFRVLRRRSDAICRDNGAIDSHAVSVKGVVVRDGLVLLLHNERDEWELPGGKLERGEDPAACVAREISEEVGWNVMTGPILDAWQYRIRDGLDVLIITYGCHTTAVESPVVSPEHDRFGLFTEEQVEALRMPDGYKHSIATWYARLRPSTADRTRRSRRPGTT